MGNKINTNSYGFSIKIQPTRVKKFTKKGVFGTKWNKLEQMEQIYII